MTLEKQEVTVKDTVEVACKSLNRSLFFHCERQMVNVAKSVPSEWSRPINGYLTPTLIVGAVVVNLFVLVALKHDGRQTPTNFVLKAISTAQILTGLSTLPWLLHYYTFKGYQQDMEYGMSWFWCQTHMHFGVNLPSFFHTAVCWLTVYLAFQRYIYICRPPLVHRYCTQRAATRVVAWILLVALLYRLPMALSRYSRFITAHPGNPLYLNDTLPYEGPRRLCLSGLTWMVKSVIGRNVYYTIVAVFPIVCVHTVPACALLALTLPLVRALKRADERHSRLLSVSYRNSNRPSVNVDDPLLPADCSPSVQEKKPEVCKKRSVVVFKSNSSEHHDVPKEASSGDGHRAETTSRLLQVCADSSAITRCNKSAPDLTAGWPAPAIGLTPPASPTSTKHLSITSADVLKLAEKRRISAASLKHKPYAVLVVVLIFLGTELTAAVLRTLHILIVILGFGSSSSYAVINLLLLARNVLTIAMYPVQQLVYCCMSASFRQSATELLHLEAVCRLFRRLRATAVEQLAISSSAENSLDDTTAPVRANTIGHMVTAVRRPMFLRKQTVPTPITRPTTIVVTPDVHREEQETHVRSASTSGRCDA